jgi:D-hexose-6-phosphate mutarotase
VVQSQVDQVAKAKGRIHQLDREERASGKVWSEGEGSDQEVNHAAQKGWVVIICSAPALENPMGHLVRSKNVVSIVCLVELAKVMGYLMGLV